MLSQAITSVTRRIYQAYESAVINRIVKSVNSDDFNPATCKVTSDSIPIDLLELGIAEIKYFLDIQAYLMPVSNIFEIPLHKSIFR